MLIAVLAIRALSIGRRVAREDDLLNGIVSELHRHFVALQYQGALLHVHIAFINAVAGFLIQRGLVCLNSHWLVAITAQSLRGEGHDRQQQRGAQQGPR